MTASSSVKTFVWPYASCRILLGRHRVALLASTPTPPVRASSRKRESPESVQTRHHRRVPQSVQRVFAAVCERVCLALHVLGGEATRNRVRHSLAALDVALKVVHQNDAKLYLLNVAPVPAGAAGFQPLPLDLCPFLETERQQQLVKLGRERIPAIVRYETLVISGDPAEQVLNTARGLDVDLIVMGTHVRRGLGHLVLGSVAERVVRESATPVLTVHSSARVRTAA